MDAAELREAWARNKDSPQFVRAHREELAEHLSDTTADHLPAPDGTTFQYRQFLNDYAGVVTRQLGESDTGEEGEE